MLLICIIAESKREPMELVNSTRRLTAQPLWKRADSCCPDRHASAPDMLHQTCITSENTDDNIQASRTRVYESGCSVVRGFTSQDAALCVDVRIRMQRCAWVYESGCIVVRGFTSQEIIWPLHCSALHVHNSADLICWHIINRVYHNI